MSGKARQDIFMNGKNNHGLTALRRAGGRKVIGLVLALMCGTWLAGGETLATPAYLPARAVDVATLLPPPPPDDSPAGQADLETVLHVQVERTPEQVARARRVAHHTAFQMGARVLGPWFTPENLPRTAAILEEVRRERQPLLAEAKRRWNRARPYERDERVQPCVERPRNSSYPSGHSASAAVWAALFSAAFPGRKAEFEAEVRETMWARVLAGVHYPSDTTAGRRLGEAIGRAMLRTDAMQRAVEEMRAEADAWQCERRAEVPAPAGT